MSKQKYSQVIHSKCGGVVTLIAREHHVALACEKCNKAWQNTLRTEMYPDMEVYKPKK